MAHGITKYDNGMVGFVEVFGGTWHKLDQYKQVDGAVSIEDARTILDYEVVKVPLAFNIADTESKIASMNGQPVITPDMTDVGGTEKAGRMFALVRTDHKIAVYGQSVSDEYEIFSNGLFMDNIENQLLKINSDLGIESVGSLWGGRVAFANILLDKFVVKGDSSPTLTRVMFWNAFGGRSIAGCCHNTRVVCNNTFMMAEAQGEVNKSLKKFKHTKMAADKVTQHLVDIVNLRKMVSDKKIAFDFLAEKQMTGNDVENFLGNLLPIVKDAGGSTITRRTNNRNDINRIFENADDLQGGIARSRYAMFNAVTNYNQYQTQTKNSDNASAWFDVATGGSRHNLNQTAFDLLVQPEIPAIHKDMALVMN